MGKGGLPDRRAGGRDGGQPASEQQTCATRCRVSISPSLMAQSCMAAVTLSITLSLILCHQLFSMGSSRLRHTRHRKQEPGKQT